MIADPIKVKNPATEKEATLCEQYIQSGGCAGSQFFIERGIVVKGSSDGETYEARDLDPFIFSMN